VRERGRRVQGETDLCVPVYLMSFVRVSICTHTRSWTIHTPQTPPKQVVLYHGLTGQLQAVLGMHHGLVYSINWAPDDSAVVTASADLTAKVWRLECVLPAETTQLTTGRLTATAGGYTSTGRSSSTAANRRPSLAHHGTPNDWTAAEGASLHSTGAEQSPLWSQQLHSTSRFEAGGATAGGSAASGFEREAEAQQGGGGSGGLVPMATLQHACFVYSAAFCPLPGLGSAVVVTGGFDGVLRLWDAGGSGGLLLYAAPVSDGWMGGLVGWL
jgi:WD40 repeat protein